MNNTQNTLPVAPPFYAVNSLHCLIILAAKGAALEATMCGESTAPLNKTGRFSRQQISQSIMQLILQTLLPNESSCSVDSDNAPGFKI